MQSTKSNAAPTSLLKFSYALTIFVGAFLMFQIQPLVGKVVTAQFGGVAAIWCVCIMFFQIALLCGYLLTYLITKSKLKRQCVAYSALMAASVLFLNVPPASGWSANAGLHPIENLLLLLSVHLALPCMLLSTVSGLMQSWYTSSELGDPYPLYGISNIGSMAALLLYPIAVEPLLGVDKALAIWRGGYVLLAALALLSAVFMFRRANNAQAQVQATDLAKPRASVYIWCTALSALATIILIVYTTYITQDIAPVPFLWILPLCIYLLAFIICFGKESAYHRKVYLYVGPIVWLIASFAAKYPVVNVVCLLGVIFCFCMVCCGEIVLRKPPPAYLPSFYLAIAFGGVVGGILVNIVAPVVLDFYAEKYAIILIMVGLCMHALFVENLQFLPHRWLNIAYIIMVCYSCLLLDGYLVYSLSHNVIARMRNFYGCLSVVRVDDGVVLASGTIVHGSQYSDPKRKREPTQYFSKDSAIGYMDTVLRRAHQPVRYAIVGLGAGTIAAYGQTGDHIKFYEIDPKVEIVARKYFTFLADSPAPVEVVIADGRKALEAESPQNLDMLVIDAFNGDAVPIHLLTREAVELYMRNVKPDGVCLLHISNRYLKLAPAIANIAHSLNLEATSMNTDASKYVAISRHPIPLLDLPGSQFVRLTISPAPVSSQIGVWTDDYSNLFAALVANLPTIRQELWSGKH